MSESTENNATTRTAEATLRCPSCLQTNKYTFTKSQGQHERIINTIPCALYDYVRWPDGRSRFFYISPQCRDIFEYDDEQIIADTGLLWAMVHPDDLPRLKAEDLAASQTGNGFQSEVRIIPPSGVTKWIKLNSRPGTFHVGGGRMWSGVILDITERKEVEGERNLLLRQLQEALDKVRVLSGFVPICSSCKKIRDDKGYWNQLEAYISEHSDAEFTHGICPDCAKRTLDEFHLLMEGESVAQNTPRTPSGGND